MMVLGADMHKASHTIAAIAAATGEMLGDKTIAVGSTGFAAALEWARDRGAERVWALEDCRHVSGAFERFLLEHGERVVRVATRLMAGERRGARHRGKSDLVDALAVARAALREGIDRLPVAELAGPELDIRLLVNHRDRLVHARTRIYNDLVWNLHDLWPELALPAARWSQRSGRRTRTGRLLSYACALAKGQAASLPRRLARPARQEQQAGNKRSHPRCCMGGARRSARRIASPARSR